MAKNVVVLYSTPEHLNSISNLALFLTAHHPSISVLLLSTAAAAPSSLPYLRLPTPDLPKPSTLDHVELSFEIPRLNNPNLERALRKVSEHSTIVAVVLDFFCNSAFDVSVALGIPTYFCNTTGAFGLCLLLHWPYIHDGIGDSIEVPGCPSLKSSALPKGMLSPQSNSYKHFLSMAVNMRRSAGIIVNSFRALELRAMEALENGLCVPDEPSPPVFSLGPLIGGGAAADHECLSWLDLQPKESVVFLCFGRGGVFDGKQLRETATGLEKSGCRFLWAVRRPAGVGDLGEVLPDGFVGRFQGKRGFVVEEWAPQAAVLGHGSVGAFVTHCGQSSLLEAVSFGVPMIGWPLYAEQKMNLVFMAEEMKVAVAVEMGEEGFVAAGEVEGRVREVMEGERGREIRRRVTEMKHSVAAAMREGGSSVLALGKFVERIITN